MPCYSLPFSSVSPPDVLGNWIALPDEWGSRTFASALIRSLSHSGAIRMTSTEDIEIAAATASPTQPTLSASSSSSDNSSMVRMGDENLTVLHTWLAVRDGCDDWRAGGSCVEGPDAVADAIRSQYLHLIIYEEAPDALIVRGEHRLPLIDDVSSDDASTERDTGIILRMLVSSTGEGGIGSMLFTPVVPLDAWSASAPVVFMNASRSEIDYVAMTAFICMTFPCIFVDVFGSRPHERGRFVPSAEQMKTAVDTLAEIPRAKSSKTFGAGAGWEAARRAYPMDTQTYKILHPSLWILGPRGRAEMIRFMRALGIFNQAIKLRRLDEAFWMRLERSKTAIAARFVRLKADPVKWAAYLQRCRDAHAIRKADPIKWAAYLERRSATSTQLVQTRKKNGTWKLQMELLREGYRRKQQENPLEYEKDQKRAGEISMRKRIENSTMETYLHEMWLGYAAKRESNPDAFAAD